MAVPHATSKGDVYAGYDIPAGTTVYGNIEYVVPQSILWPEFKPVTVDSALVKDPPYSKTRRRSIPRDSSNHTNRQGAVGAAK